MALTITGVGLPGNISLQSFAISLSYTGSRSVSFLRAFFDNEFLRIDGLFIVFVWRILRPARLRLSLFY